MSDSKENLDQTIAQIRVMRSYIAKYGKNAELEIINSESRLTQAVFGKLMIRDMNQEPFSETEKKFFDEENAKIKKPHASVTVQSPVMLANLAAQTSSFKA